MGATEKAGHTLLASLGKTCPRSGSVKAIKWLFSQPQLMLGSQVLEVACSMAMTVIGLAQRYDCIVYTIGMDKTALSSARNNVAANSLKSHIHVMAANANTLPLTGNSFDVVINETMLAMYADKTKVKLIAEYCRVLKPGRCLFTHDIMFAARKLGTDDQGQLVDVVKSNVSPMTRQGWHDLLLNCGFEQVLQQNSNMSLMSPCGLVRDEGFTGAVKIVFSGLYTGESRRRSLKMFRFFRPQRYQSDYIAYRSVKGK